MSYEILPKPATNDERTMAMLAHLSYFVLGIIGPLIIMLVKKDSPFVQDQAKEALNFQLAVLIVAMVSIITCIGPFIVAIGAIVYAIIAGLEANKGVAYRYPYTIRLVQ
jgi:uncharacterized Tic20 family protein